MNMSVDDIVKKFEEHFNKMRDLLFDSICFRSTGSQCSKNTHSFLQYLLIKAGEAAGYKSIPEVKIFLKENKLKELWENFKKELRNELGVKNLKDKRMQTFKKVDVGFAEILEKDGKRTLTFVGFGEIYTIDGYLQSLKTKEVWYALKEYFKKHKIKNIKSKNFWITARDSILSLIENYEDIIRCERNQTEKYKFEYKFNLKFVILVVVLPQEAKLVWKKELMKLKEGKEGSEILNCIKWNEVEDALKNKSEYDYHEAHIGCWKELKNEISKNNLECRLLVITEKDKNHDDFIVEPIP